MEKKNDQKQWVSIPVLPCLSIEETLVFWEMIGFKTTYKQTRPYQYGVVEKAGSQLHFAHVRTMEKTSSYSTTCLIIVTDIGKVYREFIQKIKDNLGRIPHSGIPRISRMKPETTRFTLTDVSGNAVIFISHGEKDQQTWQKADQRIQSQLQKAIAIAIRFRDYKEDDKAAAATLDVALSKAENEDHMDLAEALLIRMDLAIFRSEHQVADQCKGQLDKLCLSDEKMTYLTQKHNIEL